ncbi:helix-turn-helix domain-containing protein [Streptomyces tendae]|uniref:helix-turn-helix domain-containing protein n=1 Tax=Streptomyces tendae TaxID=1932 RepID=UPI003693B652
MKLPETDSRSGDFPEVRDGGRAGVSLASLIRNHRVRRNMTQKQLADFATISVRAVRDLESGRVRRPRRETLRLIAEALQLTEPLLAELEKVADVAVPWPPARTGPVAADPPPRTQRIIGRGAETGMLRYLLASGENRLVVVSGLPGTGKTALAVEVAHTLQESAGLTVLWSSSVPGVFEADGADAVAARLGKDPGLLVLDGCRPSELGEDLISTMLRRSPRLRIMVTASHPFPHPAVAFPLAPLPVPGSDGLPEVVASPAVRLLTRRLGLVRPDFTVSEDNCADVAELCRVVDGLPRAVELIGQWLAFYRPGRLLRLLRETPDDCLWSRATGNGVDVLGPIHDSLRLLTEDGRLLLSLLTRLGPQWTVPDVEALWTGPMHRLGGALRDLLLRGVIRTSASGDQLTFALPRLVTLASRGPSGTPRG